MGLTVAGLTFRLKVMQSTILADHWHIFKQGTNNKTLILLHGTGGDEQQMLSLGAILDDQANLLAVRGNVQEDGLNRYFVRLAEGQYDWDDLWQRSQALWLFLKQASQEYALDLDKAVLVGYSNGANIAVSLLLKQADLLKQLVLLRPLFPTDDLDRVSLAGCRVLQISGQNDGLVEVRQAEQLADYLRRNQAEVELLLTEGGHELSQLDVEATRQWLAKT